MPSQWGSSSRGALAPGARAQPAETPSSRSGSRSWSKSWDVLRNTQDSAHPCLRRRTDHQRPCSRLTRSLISERSWDELFAARWDVAPAPSVGAGLGGAWGGLALVCSVQGLDRLVSRGSEPRNQPLGARRGWTLVPIPEAVLPPVERGQEAVGITGSTGLFKQLLKFAALYNLSLIKACLGFFWWGWLNSVGFCMPLSSESFPVMH